MGVLIIGAGAIGCWLAGELAQTGAQIHLLVRPRQKAQLEEQGILFNGALRARPGIHDQIGELAGRKWQWVIITVKSFQVEQAVAELVEADLEFERLVTLQNGIGSDRFAIEAFGGERVLVATTTRAVGLVGVGSVEPAPKGGFALAAAQGRLTRAELPEWYGDLGLPKQLVESAASLKWSKLLLNMVANASCAILDMLPAELVRNRALFALELEAVREAVRVVFARGQKLVNLPDYPVLLFTRAVRFLPFPILARFLAPKIAGGRGDKAPSLMMDLQAGRGVCEVGFLNGEIARQGVELGLPTPVNHTYNQLLQGLISKELPASEYRHQPEKLLAEVEKNR